MRTETPPVIRLQDYAPPAWLIDTTELDIRLTPDATRVEARLTIRPNPDVDAPHGPLRLDGENLKLEGCEIDGLPLQHNDLTVDDDSLTINNPPERSFVLKTVVRIDPSANTQLMGLYRSNGIYTTQCEAEGFRRITYFPDRPDVLSVFTTRLEARKSDAPILLANGNPETSGDIEGTDRHFAVWHDPHPKPSYLFALVGGDLGLVQKPFTTMSGREVDLRVYVEKGKEDQAGYAMEALERSMRWDEEVFGREYDLDVFMIVAVSHFNMGAMENKGLNIFNDKYVLARAEIATDDDFEGVEAVIAHEYFHNWTGNRITCRDWFQLCLKEGLTVFRDQEFTSDVRSRPVKRIQDVRMLRALQFSEDAGPLAHPVRPEAYSEINNFYTATVYEKGAEVIRMLKALIGPDHFAKGMDLYFDRHDGDAATIEQFIACFAEASGRDLTQFMLWYSQAGTPEVTLTSSYDADAQTLAISLRQKCPPTPNQDDKSPQVIPVSMTLFGADGGELDAQREDGGDPHLIEFDAAETTIVFTGVSERPVISALREFSAPVKLRDDLAGSDRLFLLRNDTDPFNRWQAANTMMLDAVLESVRGNNDHTGETVEAVLSAASDDALDPAFRAELLMPPSYGDVAQALERDVDPDAIHAALERLRAIFASKGGSILAGLIEAMSDRGPYVPDADGSGRRALKGTALALHAANGDEQALERARSIHDTASNMTDRLSALSVLVQRAPDRGAQALEDFYTRFSGYPLVVDKWFSLQAGIPDGATLDTVCGLMDHPAFSMENPNRVRSLIGRFAAGNPVAFNRKDGEGYRFVTERVRELDTTNPQVAARLLGAFRSWKMLEAGRRALARKSLESVAEQGNLSPDVTDIVGRSLA